jgi:hypothetical protein
MVMLFLGCMVNVLPHFLKPRSSSDAFDSARGGANEDLELCNLTLRLDLSGAQSSAFSRHARIANSSDLLTETGYTSKRSTASTGFQLKYLLYAANIINGLSSASMTTITFSYIEDIAPHSLSAVYEGIYYATGAFGVSSFL